MRIRGGPVTDERRRLGREILRPYRTQIAPQHSVRWPRNMIEIPRTPMSQSHHRPFPSTLSLCSTGNREEKEQCGLGLVGQRRGSRPFLERCVVEEAPAWLEVKAHLRYYWRSSLHLLSQLWPISTTITFKTGIWPPAPALPFASAMPLLPPGLSPPRMASTPFDPHLHSFSSKVHPGPTQHIWRSLFPFWPSRSPGRLVHVHSLVLRILQHLRNGLGALIGERSCHAYQKMIELWFLVPHF